MQTITTAFTNPQTIISNGQYTGSSWNNPNNLLTLDGSYASTPATLTLGSDVVVGNFIFTDSNFNPIPQNSNISGIEISFTGYRGVSADPATALEIYAYDNTNGNNFFYLLTPVFAGFTTSPITYYFGSSSFLFNTTWTADQINNLKIRLQGNGQLFIDNLQVRITYTPPAGSTVVTQDVCESLFQAQPFKLIAPVSADVGDVNWLIDKFETSDGVPITNGDIGAIGIPITTDQGTPNEENGYVTSVMSTAGNQRIITVSRGWSFRDPNTQTAPLRQHGSGAKVEIANSIQFYDIFLRLCQIGTLVSAPISGLDEGVLITDYIRSINVVGGGAVFSGTPAISGGGFDMVLTVPGFTTTPPTEDNAESFCSGSTQVNTLTVPFEVNGVDRWMIVQISLQSAETVTSVTYDGVPMVFDNAINQGDVRIESWILTTPNLGINDLVIVTSGLTYLAGNIVSWNSVDQITPWTPGTAFSGNGSTSTGTQTTTTQNSIVLHLLATELVGINYTAGGGENIISDTLSCVMQGAVQTQLVGTIATVTSNIQLSLPTDWANIFGSLNGVTPIAPTAGVDVYNSGVFLGTFTSLNLINPNISAIDAGGGQADVSTTGGASGQTAIQFDDETGTPLGTPGTVNEVEVTGLSVTGVRVGNKVTYTIAGGTGVENTFNPYTAGVDFTGATTPQVVVWGDGSNINFAPLVSNTSQIIDGQAGGSDGFAVQLNTLLTNIMIEGVLVENTFATGVPIDTLVVSIQTDVAGLPSGVVLTSQTFSPGAALHVSFPSPIQLTAGVDYWVVYQRSGAGSAINYYNIAVFNNTLGDPTFARNSAGWSQSQYGVGGGVFVQFAVGSVYPASDSINLFLYGITNQTTPALLKDVGGFVNTTITQGNPIDTISDGYVDGFIGLTPVADYFLQNDSTLNTTGTLKAGRATLTTQLLIRRY